MINTNTKKQYQQTKGLIQRLVNVSHLLSIGVIVAETFSLRECLLFTSLSWMENNFSPNRQAKQSKSQPNLARYLCGGSAQLDLPSAQVQKFTHAYGQHRGVSTKCFDSVTTFTARSLAFSKCLPITCIPRSPEEDCQATARELQRDCKRTTRVTARELQENCLKTARGLQANYRGTARELQIILQENYRRTTRELQENYKQAAREL